MSLSLLGNYNLRLSFGDTEVAITPEMLQRFEINFYLSKFLPVLYAELRDPIGFLTHLTPHDSRFNTITVSFSNRRDVTNPIDLKFKIFRRRPESVVEVSSVVHFEAFLDVKNLFSPNYERGWTDSTVSEIIGDIVNDLGVEVIRPMLGMSDIFSIVQPNWTNAQFLSYLCSRVKSGVGDFGFFAYVDIPMFTTTRFNFVSIVSLLKQKAKYTFVHSTETQTPDLPIYSYEIVDNFDLIANMGLSKQTYGYFNWPTGEYLNRDIELSEVTFDSLSQYIGYDSTDNIDGLSQNYIGRTNPLVSDYDTVARGNYYKKINSISKMWISTDGNPAINPGDVVKVIFKESNKDKNSSIFSYQYSGFWLVEHIKHHFGSTFITRVLLTRPGFDTDKETTFTRAPRVKIA